MKTQPKIKESVLLKLNRRRVKYFETVVLNNVWRNCLFERWFRWPVHFWPKALFTKFQCSNYCLLCISWMVFKCISMFLFFEWSSRNLIRLISTISSILIENNQIFTNFIATCSFVYKFLPKIVNKLKYMIELEQLWFLYQKN